MELSACVKDGAARRAGAVAVAMRPRHPVELARRVLDAGGHVLYAGEAADELAAEWGLAVEPNAYFVAAGGTGRPHRGGTVGAVACDGAGHLAAATSTGGVRGQHPGRVGDTPIVGAGTWADDRTCAVSATGDGDVFVRAAFAHDVHARMHHAHADLAAACASALEDVRSLGGRGGCIAVDRQGNVVMPFTTRAMVRGLWRPGDGQWTAAGRISQERPVVL